MPQNLHITASTIGTAKVYQFEIGVSGDKYLVNICCELEKESFLVLCDQSKHVQAHTDFLLLIQQLIPSPAVVSVTQNNNIWFATKNAQVLLLRNQHNLLLIDENQWGSGVYTDLDSFICLWGESKDLNILSTSAQVLSLVSARIKTQKIHGMMLTAKVSESKTEINLNEDLRSEVLKSAETSVSNQELVEEVLDIPPKSQAKSSPKWIYLLPDRQKIDQWEAKFHVENYRPKGRSFMKYLGIIFLLFLFFIGTIGWWQTKGEEIKLQWDQQLVILNQKVEEAILIGKTNHIRAENLLEDADGVLTQLSKSGLASDQIETLRQKISSVRSNITGTFNTSPATWFTLNLIRQDLTADDIDYNNSELWLLDKQGQRIVSINVDTKSAQIIWGQENVGQALTLAKSDNFTWWTDNFQITSANRQAIPQANWDNAYGQVVDSGSFADNYYVMTTQGIIRCTISDGLNCSEWLKQDAKDKWINYRTMAIDTRIYVANETLITRIASGVQESWSVNGLDQEWNEIFKIFTNDQSQNLYVFDRGAKRVVSINKETGNFQKSYTWDKLNTIIDIAIDESRQKMWWIAKDLIYEVSLN